MSRCLIHLQELQSSAKVLLLMNVSMDAGRN